ncbi:MAG: hypothetical protein ACP5KJ_00615 [Candidatus Micrarchaeia archaeon]
MAISITRSQAIQLIVILTAIVFIASTLSIWFRSSNSSPPSVTQSGQASIEQNVSIGRANIVLILESYSPVVKSGVLNDDASNYVKELAANGKVQYIDTSNPSYTTIVLSNKDDVYNFTKTLLSLDTNASIMLEAYVYSNEEFDFITPEGIVRTSIPRSKITLTSPYPVGSMLAFNALAQFSNGKIVNAKLTPLAITDTAEMQARVDELYPYHYVRMFFFWHDRVAINNSYATLKESLSQINATNISMRYVRNDVAYASRPLTIYEIASLQEMLPGVKMVRGNEIVIYSNYSYTENDVSDGVANATNNSVSISFSPPLLEIVFDYTGPVEKLDEVLDEFEYTPISKEVYRRARITIPAGNVTVNGKEYEIAKNIEITALVPYNAQVGGTTSVKIRLSILGDQIVSAEQVLEVPVKVDNRYIK